MPYANYFPRGINNYVPTAQYAIDANMDNNIETLDLGAPLALDTAGILLTAGPLVVTQALTITAFTAGTGTATAIGYNGMVPFQSTSVPGGWGRALSMVASVTPADRVVTVTGYDYLGQKMVENMTFSGTAAVNGKKAFAWLESISVAAGTDTATFRMGWTNIFGIPYTGEQMIGEVKNGVIAANAGAFTAGLVSTTAANATSADSRGTYTPSTVLPNGTNTFRILYTKRTGPTANLHGIAQFAG